jgi:4-alpha-glucanotransferase
MQAETRQQGRQGNALSQRSAGWLMHPTSLFSLYGCGDIGPAARIFVEQLEAAGVGWWQMLPTHPVGNAPGFSPYSAPSAFATSPMLASVEDLADVGLLSRKDLASRKRDVGWQVDYPRVIAERDRLLRAAFAEFAAAGGRESKPFVRYVNREGSWLMDWAVFAAARGRSVRPRPWTKFAGDLAKHEATAIFRFVEANREEVEYHLFVQFVLDGQWGRLVAHAKQRGVKLMGDVPIFVSHDSADVWSRRGLWELDGKGKATRVSGVPPDLFSSKGQLWGHPQYRWGAHAKEGFAWWMARFGRMLTLFDAVRIDHFLGFARVWSVPAGSPDARRGKWVATPGREIFTALAGRIPDAAILAEDLGVPNPVASRLREDFGFPGMRVLQFGFNGGDEHLPHGYDRACVAYTGTHDNDTSAGWYASASSAERAKAGVLGIHRATAASDMIRTVLASVADTAVVPVQDVLSLGTKHRMNYPGTAKGNWGWRLRQPIAESVLGRFRKLTEATKRLAK